MKLFWFFVEAGGKCEPSYYQYDYDDASVHDKEHLFSVRMHVLNLLWSEQRNFMYWINLVKHDVAAAGRIHVCACVCVFREFVINTTLSAAGRSHVHFRDVVH